MINLKGFERNWSWPNLNTTSEFDRGTEEGHENPQSEKPVSRPGLKANTARIQV
jgi:hypothetical protein